MLTTVDPGDYATTAKRFRHRFVLRSSPQPLVFELDTSSVSHRPELLAR